MCSCGKFLGILSISEQHVDSSMDLLQLCVYQTNTYHLSFLTQRTNLLVLVWAHMFMVTESVFMLTHKLSNPFHTLTCFTLFNILSRHAWALTHVEMTKRKCHPQPPFRKKMLSSVCERFLPEPLGPHISTCLVCSGVQLEACKQQRPTVWSHWKHLSSNWQQEVFYYEPVMCACIWKMTT